jgi:hypothetical protein
LSAQKVSRTYSKSGVRFEVHVREMRLPRRWLWNTVSWNLMPRNFVVYWRFGGRYRLHLQSLRIGRSSRQSEGFFLNYRAHCQKDTLTYSSENTKGLSNNKNRM